MYNFNPLLYCSKSLDNKVFNFNVLCDGRLVCSFEKLEDATIFKNNLQNSFQEYKYSVKTINKF